MNQIPWDCYHRTVSLWNTFSYSVMLICVMPTILEAGLMIGLDPNSTQKTKLVYSPAHFWLALSVRRSCCCLLRMHRKSIRVVNISRRLKLCHSYLLQEHCWTLKGSYHQCSYARLVCRRQHPRHADFPTEARPGYTSGKISIIATLSAVFDCCFDAAV